MTKAELLALTPADFDFEKGTVTINKSYQRIGGRDVITDPKTPKSNRTIKMPQFLCDEIQGYGITEHPMMLATNKRIKSKEDVIRVARIYFSR